MSQGLYIVGTGPRSGKSIVVLGMMELLVRQGRKIGYFRPVAHESGGQDHAIGLIAELHKLDFPYESMYGCTYDEAMEFLRAGHPDELYGTGSCEIQGPGRTV